MPSIEESLSKIRSGGSPAAGSIEDSLAKLRGPKLPSPSRSYEDRRSAYDDAMTGKVVAGDVVRIGPSIFKAAQRPPAGDDEFPLLSPDERKRLLATRSPIGFEPVPGGVDVGFSLEESLDRLRAGKPASLPSSIEGPAPNDPNAPIPGATTFMQDVAGIFQDAGQALRDTGIPGLAAHASHTAAVPFQAPKMPGSIMETLQAIRVGQAPIPGGPAAFTEPTALAERAGGQVKEAAGAALKAEDAPKEGLFSKVIGKLLMAPTEAALGLPVGMLSKIEDAVGKAAISPTAQEVLRQAVLSQPFKPSELQEAVGVEGIFLGAGAGLRSVLGKFPGLAGRLGFQEATEVVQEAVRRGVKIPVSPAEVKAFYTGVGEIDPVVANSLKEAAGQMGSEKFNATLKEVLSGKRRFFVEVPRETLPARAGLPSPAGAAAEPPKQSIDESLRLLRSGQGLPTPGEAAKVSGRRKEFDPDFIRMLEDKAQAGVPFSANDRKVIEVLREEGYNVPNERIEPNGAGADSPVVPGGSGAGGPGGSGGPLAAPVAGPSSGRSGAPGGVDTAAAVSVQSPGAVAAPAPVGGVPAPGLEPGQAPGVVPVEGSGAPGPSSLGAAGGAPRRKAGPRAGAGKPPVEPGGDAQAAPPAGPAAPSEGKSLPQEGPKRPPVKVVASEEAVAKLIPKRSTLPILHSFKVEGGKMAATSLDVFIEKKTDRADGMYKFVGKDVVPSDAKAEDYPVIPDEKNFEPAGTVDRDDLIHNFERVEKASSTDETRFILQSVAMRVQDGAATLVATDGRRLSMSPLDTAKIKDGTYVIQADAGVADAIKSLSPGKIEFGVGKDGQLQFKAADGRVVTRGLEGTFPNFEQIIPEAETQHTVSRSALEQALKDLKPYAKADRKFAPTVRIEKKKDGTLVLSAGPADSKKTIEIPATEEAGQFSKIKAGTIVMPMEPKTGEPAATFGIFQVPFLSDAVASVRGENVVIGRHSRFATPFTVSGKAAEKIVPKAKKAPKGKASYEMDEAGEPPKEPAKPAEASTPVIEMPELVEMAKDLLDGKVPKVMESLRKMGARGVFFPGKGEIALSSDIAKDPAGAAKTLAHEIGHARDWLSDKEMAKGNILGRIASVPGYVKSMIETLPDQPGKVLTDKEREKLRHQVVNSILKKMGKTLQQYIKDPALKKAVAAEVPAAYKARLAEEVKSRGLITKDEIMDELKALNQKWKPFDVNANPKFTAYRYSPEELYADATSVLFNDPALIEKMAPKFYKSLFAYMDRKPEVKASYDKIVERIRGGKVQEVREEGVEEMFEAGERQAAAERLATQKTARDVVESVRDELLDRNEGVLAYLRKAKKAGKVVRPEDSPQYALEEMNYVSSEVKAHLESYNEILKDLNEAGLAWKQLGHRLFHERVINERGELFNPRGFTPETSRKQLEFSEKRLGPEKWGALTKAVDKFRESREGVLDIMAESGMFSDDLMNKATNNPFYATFDVFSKHADDAGGGSGIGASIHGQIGTLQEISNPATATLMKDVALIKAIRRNDAVKKTISFLEKEFDPSVVRPAQTKWNGKFHEPQRPKDPNKDLLAYMEGGKIKVFVVDKWVANAFDRDPGEASAVLDAARLSQKFFREIFTQKNPGFQLFNLWRDYFRAYKNLPGISFAGLTRHYIKALTPAFRRGFDIPDQLISEMLRKKMLITVEDKWGLSTDDEQVEAVMDRYFGNKAKEDPGLKDKFLSLFKWVGDIGSAIEAMPKVAGYQYLKEHQKELGLSDKELAHMVRGQVGSPDFMRKGRGYSWMNNIFMFSNAIKEGWRSDLEVMRARPGEYAWKTFKANMTGKLLMLGAAAGLMGLKMKDMMDGVPEYDKTNYLVIPLGKTPQGRTVYMRLPQDEAGRFISGLFWKMATGSADPQNLADYMAGQAPTLNPVLGAAADTVMYTSGKNPYDFFRQRNVIPEQEFEAGGWRSHRIFLKHLANTLGAGIVHQFKTNDLQKVKTELEEGLGLPIASNIIGRFIKVSDYGKAEKIRQEVQKSRKDQARETLDERDALVQHLNAVDKPGPGDAAKLYGDMVKDGMLRRGRGTGVVTFQEFFKEYNRFAAKRGGDPYINALVYAKGNEERADLLAYYRKTMSKADYQKLLAEVMGEGLLTAKPLMLSYIEEKDK